MAKQKYQLGFEDPRTGLDFYSRQLFSKEDGIIKARDLYRKGIDINLYPTTLQRTRKRQKPIKFW